MEQSSRDASDRRARARWQANAMRAVQLNDRARTLAVQLHKGWEWASRDAMRDDVWIVKLGEYEGTMRELQEVERAMRDGGLERA